jgi:hypothetical protein
VASINSVSIPKWRLRKSIASCVPQSSKEEGWVYMDKERWNKYEGRSKRTFETIAEHTKNGRD